MDRPTRFRCLAIVTTALVGAGAGACGDAAAPPPVIPPPPEFVAAKVSLTLSRSSAAPRDTVSVTATVRNAEGRHGADVAVTFDVTAGDGTLIESGGATDTAGRVSANLVLGRAEIQRIRARADTVAGEATVRVRPILARLVLEPADTTVTELEAPITLRITAIDRDSVVIDTPENLALNPSAEIRALASLPVLNGVSTAQTVQFSGPGWVELTVRNGTVVSTPSRFTVSPAVAFIDSTDAPALVEAGDTVSLRGYRLDLLPDDAVTVDDVAAPLVSADSAVARFTAPARDFAGCQGMATGRVAVDGAITLAPLAFRYQRDGEVSLPVGTAQALGAVSPQCMRLAPAEEYMLLFLDGRGPRIAEATSEGDTLMNSPFTASIGDRSLAAAVPAAVPAGGFASLAPAPARRHRPPDPPAVVAADPPPDAYFFRRTPWAVGDSVSFNERWPDGTAEWRRGRIVHVAGMLAAVVMDYDSASNLPARLGNLYPAMDTAIATSIPLLRAALTDSLVEASIGTGQILVTVRDIGWTGGSTNGTGQVLLSPFPLPSQTGPIEFVWFETLTHELAHVWQDRWETAFCQETRICGPALYNPWGFEGGADFLTEEAGRTARGFSLDANVPWFSLKNGAFYAPCCTDSIPGATFEFGYAGSAWFLRYLLHRAIDAGAGYETAIREVARGAYEGWYGRAGGTGDPYMPGLQPRLTPWFGDWVPVSELVTGAMTVAMDDRPSSTLNEPSIVDAWQLFGAPAVIETGSGGEIPVSSRGTGFGYVLLRDAGFGGTYELTASLPDVEWAIARVR